MVSAYLVTLPPGVVPNQAVFLDCAKAVDYAASHHGSGAALTLLESLNRMRAELESLKAQLDALRV
jgi:hypothetical protein